MAEPVIAPSTKARLPLVDAVRALAATLVAWHHIAIYGPISYLEPPGWTTDILWNFSWAVQAFFVIGGYMMASTMSPQVWDCRRAGQFVVRRYCRLGLPYLVAMLLAIEARAFGRGWLPQRVVDFPATWDQIAAHVLLLQDILGFDSLSAGFWFVAIDFQLGLVWVALLYLRDALGWLFGLPLGERSGWLPLAIGWALAAPALFVFNGDERLDMWAIYFFGQFFMGVMLYHGLKAPRFQTLFGLYMAMLVTALALNWRWQLTTSIVTGLLLFAGGKLGLMERWPTSRLVSRLGITSYSLFLVHFPVTVVVSTLWVRLEFTSMPSAVAASLVAYIASLAVAEAFYRLIELPTVRLGARIGR